MLMLVAVAPLCAQPAENANFREQLDLELTAMEIQGSAFRPQALDDLGVAGLTGVLDRFFPETAVKPRAIREPKLDELRPLIEQLGSEEFRVRETATEKLIVRGQPARKLLEVAAESDDAEVRLRARRILAAWEPKSADGIDRALAGLWCYLQLLKDDERHELLASRILAEFSRGWPEGSHLHALRLCIAGVAKGGGDSGCDRLRPLVANKDARIARFVTETVGSYKADDKFYPRVLLDALADPRDEVVEVALRWTRDCPKSPRADEVRRALATIFAQRDDALKFQATMPLIHDFDAPEAWVHLIRETQSKAPLRAASALSSLADAKFTGRQASDELITQLRPLLDSPTLSLRWGATKALGTHAGENVVELLVPLLGDKQQSVVEEASRGLLKQPEIDHVRKHVSAALTSDNVQIGERAADLLLKLKNK
jgi:HEAT repeat protein